MSAYVILVEFDIKPGLEDTFATLIRDNAAQSLAVEPGCQRFDVWLCAERERTIVLYEIYENEQAFRDHLTRPHFLSFDRETAAMVEAKRVRELRSLDFLLHQTEGC